MSSSNSACMLSNFSRIWLFATPQTVARQVPLSMGLYWQRYWSWFPFPSSGELPNSGIKSCLLWLMHWQVNSLLLSLLGSPSSNWDYIISFFLILCLFFFPCLIALANMSNTKLNRSVKNGNSCPWLQRKSIQLFSPLSMMLAVNLFYMAFILSKYIPSLANVLIFLS